MTRREALRLSAAAAFAPLTAPAASAAVTKDELRKHLASCKRRNKRKSS